MSTITPLNLVVRLSPSLEKKLDAALNNYFWVEEHLTGGGGPGIGFREPGFDFVRDCKAITELKGISSAAFVRLVDQWADGDVFYTEVLKFKSESEGQVALARLWDTIKFGTGEGTLKTAYDLSLDEPLFLSDEHFINDTFQNLVGLCWHLQRMNPESAIFLARTEVAQAMGFSSPQTASSYIRMAEQFGFLRKVSEHNHAAGRAAEYHFCMDRIDPVTREERVPDADEQPHRGISREELF